jgi:hypothetical protein
VSSGVNKAGLQMTRDPYPWTSNLSELYAQVWTRLARGVADRRAPARHPTLTTVSPEGKPKSRTVVLRASNSSLHTLDLHTDLRSAKIDDLKATPFGSLHIWDSGAHLQIRLEASVAVLKGADVAAIWARLPEHTQLTYGVIPAPGRHIPDALAYTRTLVCEHFSVLRLRVEAIEVLHLGADHRRAHFTADDDWAGKWLVP